MLININFNFLFPYSCMLNPIEEFFFNMGAHSIAILSSIIFQAIIELSKEINEKKKGKEYFSFIKTYIKCVIVEKFMSLMF